MVEATGLDTKYAIRCYIAIATAIARSTGTTSGIWRCHLCAKRQQIAFESRIPLPRAPQGLPKDHFTPPREKDKQKEATDEQTKTTIKQPTAKTNKSRKQKDNNERPPKRQRASAMQPRKNKLKIKQGQRQTRVRKRKRQKKRTCAPPGVGRMPVRQGRQAADAISVPNQPGQQAQVSTPIALSTASWEAIHQKHNCFYASRQLTKTATEPDVGATRA